MKKLLKKIRTKWHRDIADFHFEDKSIIQNLEKSLKDTQASLCNTEKVFLEKLTESGQSLKAELLETRKEISEMKHVITPPPPAIKGRRTQFVCKQGRVGKSVQLVARQGVSKIVLGKTSFCSKQRLGSVVQVSYGKRTARESSGYNIFAKG